MRATKPKWYLTTREVAYILDVSTGTVRDYIYQGILDGWTEDDRRILILFRDLIAMMREHNKSYHAYRACMISSGWHETSKEQSHRAESGSILVVRVQPRVYEHWYNQADDAKTSETIADHFWHKRIHIVPMGDTTPEEAEEIEEAYHAEIQEPMETQKR